MTRAEWHRRLAVRHLLKHEATPKRAYGKRFRRRIKVMVLLADSGWLGTNFPGVGEWVHNDGEIPQRILDAIAGDELAKFVS